MFEGRQINESPSLVYRLCKTYPLLVIFIKPVSWIYLDFFSLRRGFFCCLYWIFRDCLYTSGKVLTIVQHWLRVTKSRHMLSSQPWLGKQLQHEKVSKRNRFLWLDKHIYLHKKAIAVRSPNPNIKPDLQPVEKKNINT